MKQRRTSLPCGFQEDALIAAALDEADTTLQQAVHRHIRTCQECSGLWVRYRSLQQVFTTLQDTRSLEEPLHRAQERLTQLLVRRPVVHLAYHWFPTTLGTLCIAKSAQGVSLLTWELQARQLLSTLGRQAGVEVHEDEAALQALGGELQAYLAGTCDHLPWSIDERCMRSAFQREVLKLTATIPYGAVMSYQGLAAALGQPKAVRAVAQALGHNPLAIVIPCHRVIGQTGHLTGYAGGLERKCTLLSHEGIPLLTRPGGVFVNKERMYVGWRTERAYCKPRCPSLVGLTPGDRLLMSPRAIAVQPDFVPCDVCHPEELSV
jgi:methylated-DNA-[protein]-cysteine S-methyltransferase